MQKPEFSRIIDLDELQSGASRHHFVADAEERAALASRFEVNGISLFEADVELTISSNGRRVRLVAEIVANVQQTCVVSLKRIESNIKEVFNIAYVRSDLGHEDKSREVEIAGLEDEEPLDQAEWDLGEVLAGEIGSIIDPYPRAPGVEPADSDSASEETVTGRVSPFLVLKNLKTEK